MRKSNNKNKNEIPLELVLDLSKIAVFTIRITSACAILQIIAFGCSGSTKFHAYVLI